MDNPELDGTDGAHPAWWRGCDSGVESTVQAIHQILDDIENDVEPHGKYSSKKLEMLRDRLYLNYFRQKNTISP